MKQWSSHEQILNIQSCWTLFEDTSDKVLC